MDGDEEDPWAEALDQDEALAAEEAGDAAAARQRVESSRDNLVFLIDCRKNMLTKNQYSAERNRSFLVCALQFVVELLKTKCQRDPGSRVAVILLGAAKSAAHMDLPNVHTLLDLQEPSVTEIKQLQAYASDAGVVRLADKVGGFLPADGYFPLDGGLWECSWLFNKHTRPQDQHRIWLLTNDDAPRLRDKVAALQRARDALAQRARFLLWPLAVASPGAPAFDTSKLWDDVLLVTESGEGEAGAGGGGGGRRHLQPGADELEPDDDEAEDGAGAAASSSSSSSAAAASAAAASSASAAARRFGNYVTPTSGDAEDENLARELSTRLFPKRVYSRLCFDLLPNVTISVGMYNPVMVAKRPYGKLIHKATGDAVVSQRRDLDKDTGEVLDGGGMVKYHIIGGKRVYFMEAEVKDLKTVLGEGKGLKLLCFKPRAEIRGVDNVRHPQFIYPSEREIAGSTAAFRALHTRMVARDVVAIARLQMRDNSEPRIVALFPQLEELDVTGEAGAAASSSSSAAGVAGAADAPAGMQRVPPGMVVVQLPFADDMRVVKQAVADVTASAADVAVARDVVTALSLEDFDAFRHDIRNPSIAKFWSVVEQAALGAEKPSWDDAVHDSSRPQDEGMRESAEEELGAFVTAFGLSAEGTLPVVPKAGKASSGVGAKRSKAAAGAGGEGSGSKAKKPRLAPDAGEEADAAAEVRAAVAAGTLSSRAFTVDALKGFCRALGLKVSGTKGDLATRLEEHVATLPADEGAGAGGSGAAGAGDGDEAEGEGEARPARKRAAVSKTKAAKGGKAGAARRRKRADDYDDEDDDAEEADAAVELLDDDADEEVAAEEDEAEEAAPRRAAKPHKHVGSSAGPAEEGESEWSEEDEEGIRGIGHSHHAAASKGKGGSGKANGGRRR